MPFELFTTYYLTTNPGILTPGGTGTLIKAIPAGSYVEANLTVSDVADQPGTFEINATFNGGGVGSPLGMWDYAPSITGGGAFQPEPPAANLAGSVEPQSTPRLCFFNNDGDIRLHFTPVGADPSFFQGQVVLKIYS